jgi:hypothetical protein
MQVTGCAHWIMEGDNTGFVVIMYLYFMDHKHDAYLQVSALPITIT